MATMSVSGVVSGMDWDGMIDEIITNAAKPAQVKVSKKTNLTNKKSLFEEMKVTMNSLQSSLSPLKLPSTYKAKTIDIERLDSTKSYKGVLTATVNADAEVNVWDVEVKQLASAQTNRSKQITASNLNSTLSGVTGSTMYINAGGQKIGVEVKSSDTLESLKSRINTTLKTLDNPIHVTASVVDNKLILKSDYTGLGAFTANETINYSSNGVNTITGFSVSDDTRENVKITNGSTTYTYGTDYVIVNGNEIRWKKYDQSKEVALDDTVTVKYNMAARDKYEKTGTYRTNEVSISGFTPADNSRLKITDDNNVPYTYGKDFELDSSGKVVWLEEKEATTNEPDSYTVSYTKTEQKSYAVSGEKISPMKIPESYTVSYDKVLEGTVSAVRSSESVLDLQIINNSNLPTHDEFRNTYGLGITSGTTLDFNGSSADKIEIIVDGNVSSDYAYGTDFTVRKSSYGSTSPYYGMGHASIAWNTSSTKPTNGYTVRYTHTYNIAADDSTYDTDLAEIITEAGTDTANIKITGADGTEYVNGVHFKIENGGITWKITEEVVDVDDTEFAELQTKYAEAAGSELNTVTLIDGNGVLRTYVDPEDTSLFTMSAGGVNYEYGRDYVLRVNDAGTGYCFDWLVENSDTITDANTTVATYAAYKNISTSEWQAAPAEGTAYNFGFSYNYESTPITGTVNKTDTDKTLNTVLRGTSVSSSDYSSLSITSGTNKYYYGVDFGIDSSGSIVWRKSENGSMPTSYTVNYAGKNKTLSPSDAGTLTSGGSGFPNIDVLMNNYGFQTIGNTNLTLDVYSSDSPSDYEFVITTPDSNGDYVYGRDYVIQKAGASGSRNSLIAWGSQSPAYTNAYKTYINSHPADYDSDTFNAVNGTQLSKPTSNYTVSLVHKADNSDLSGVSACINEANGNYSDLTITDNNGKTYTYVASTASLTDDTFTIVDGLVTFKTAEAPIHPTGEYKLTYEAFGTLTAAGTYNDSTPQEVSIAIDSGYGNYGDTSLSYEQILSDTGLTSSSSSDDWKKYFTLTDDDDNTYTYGTDYTIIQGSDTDSSTGEHNVMINWLKTPASGTDFTLKYTGRAEVLTTDGVKRSATDTIIGSPSATDFDGGTNTITYGSKTFYEGIDFDIDADSSGYATVTWISDKISDNDGGHEWYYPTSNSYYTINHTDDNGNTTTYNASRTGSATLSISEMKTANGSISVEYGGGLPYKLNAPDIEYDDGTSATIAEAIKAAYGFSVTPTTGNSYTFSWDAPTLTSRTNLPAYGTELTVSYEYDANTFDLSDDGDGDLLQALGFTKSDGTYDDYTAAKNAILVIDGGQEVERDSNDIGADYENELIKGVTMHLKGLGEVSLDISQDAEKAVESIQTFVDNYNDLMTWMNTRMTEKQLDEDTAATVDSDDFRMRWGLLHGNSLLRQTKSQMRSLTSQNFTFSFTQRKSSGEIYGTMGFNGLKSSSTLRLRIGTKYVDVTIDPADTLETIVAKISDDSKGGAMNDIYYDDNGEKLRTPLLKAYVENDKLVIQSSDNSEITMSGSAAMNALKMNYTYKGLYQIGIESTSEDYGKSGELVFDANEFMKALEDNPDEVQALMMKFVTQFDTWTKSMLNSSSSGQTSGTLTREIENIQSQIDSINEYLETYQERLDRMEENLRTRYGNTETQFARLSQQASSIAAILNQLNGTAQGGGYGQTSS